MSFSGRENNGKGVRGSFFNNVGLKVLALIFALVLWFFVVGEESSEVGLMVPLGLKGIPAEMIVTKTPGVDVEVRVAGPGGFLEKLSPSDVTVALSLGDAKDGRNTYRLAPVNVKVPSGLRVLTVRPSSVDIRLERLVKRMLPVKVKTRGVAAKGFKVKSITVEPASVHVLGRKRVMKKIEVISTETFDISGADKDITETLHLDLSRKGLSGAEPDSVTLKVDVEKVTSKKSKIKNKGKAKP